MGPRELRTGRLVLRGWRPEDLEPFAAMNADPRVMRYFPAALSRGESDALALRSRGELEAQGWGRWVLEVPGLVACAGFVGLSVPGFAAAFQPCVEIGWRLAAECQGRGYASEAARRVLRFAAEDLRLGEVVSFTPALNLPSIRVMERIGMRRDPSGDFDHPLVPEGHRLRPHVLYRWRAHLSRP